MTVVDTNIWIYSHDTRTPDKQQKAQELIAQIQDHVLPWQVGCEFMAASRKLLPLGFDQAKAWRALTTMRNLAASVLLPVPEVWGDAQSLQERLSLSFWDALLIATCLRGSVKQLYSEDFGGVTVSGLTVLNPFQTP